MAVVPVVDVVVLVLVEVVIVFVVEVVDEPIDQSKIVNNCYFKCYL